MLTNICRICGTVLLKPLLVLENMPLTDDFVLTSNLDRKEYLQDITIFACPSCDLIQNPVDFECKDYYRDYQYSSGYSVFVQKFMRRYAQVVCEEFYRLHLRQPASILEIGSGDGEQLKQFKCLSVSNVLGVEPSEFLAEKANTSGITTLVDYFGAQTKNKLTNSFDVCLSSYTLDHVRNPIEYLRTAYDLLNTDGLLVFEVHDLEKIVERTEYCLFEHEHTIYLTAFFATQLLNSQGFTVIAINPLSTDEVRGNSLIVVAKKNANTLAGNALLKFANQQSLLGLETSIKTTINRLDAWIASLPEHFSLVGFGAGGRGVMTLAALKNFARFKALFDSNYETAQYLTPKTRIPVVGPDQWSNFKNAYCLVFSYGYFTEICCQLIYQGFQQDKIISLADFFPGSSE
jgi:SAM-dependent methyltransferase